MMVTRPTDRPVTTDTGVPTSASVAENANVKHRMKLEYRLNQHSVNSLEIDYYSNMFSERTQVYSRNGETEREETGREPRREYYFTESITKKDGKDTDIEKPTESRCSEIYLFIYFLKECGGRDGQRK